MEVTTFLLIVCGILIIIILRELCSIRTRCDQICERINALEVQVGEMKGLDMRNHWAADDNRME